MRTFEVRFKDGSRELVEADSHELVGTSVHFIRQAGPSGEEKWKSLEASRISSITEVMT